MDTKVLSSGIRYTNLPQNYIRPEPERPRLSEVVACDGVPVIDLDLPDTAQIMAQTRDACSNYGFFQVINHGVEEEVVAEMAKMADEFFRLPVKEKMKLYPDDPAKTIRLSTSSNIKREKVKKLRDYLRLHCYPLDKYATEWPSNHPLFNSKGVVQGLNIIPPTQSNEGEREDREPDLNSGAILIQIDGQASPSLISGEQQGPILQQNAIGIPETPPLESYLLVTAQVFVTLLTAWLGNGKNHLSFSAKILRDFAVGSTIVGYISSFSSMLMCRLSTSRASRILNTVAYAGAAFGFMASMSMLLPDELRLWVTFLSCAACLPALAAGFCN